MSKEPIMLFVEVFDSDSAKVIISNENLEKLGVKNGDIVEVIDKDTNKTTSAFIEGSTNVLEFAGKFSKLICDKLGFKGVELGVQVRSDISITPELTPSEKISIPITPPTEIKPPKIEFDIEQPQPMKPQTPTYAPPEPQLPIPGITPPPSPPGLTPTPPPPPQPSPTYAPPKPQMPTPGLTPPPQPPQIDQLGVQPSGLPETEIAPAYTNQIDIYTLQTQKSGLILTPKVVDDMEGRIHLSENNLRKLGLGVGMLIAWEDPLTRSVGSARISMGLNVPDNQIIMDQNTKEDTNLLSDQVVVFSTEPPIQKMEEISLEVNSKPELSGFCHVSPRIMHSLSVQPGNILAFEDELTGAIGAAKVQINERMPSNQIVIDNEILEASGIGSYEVIVRKNPRQIISLQSITLGLSPIKGENMWELISTIRQNVDALKNWLMNYIIFKGIKLRWNVANVACSVIDCIPDLTGDIFAQVSPNTTLSLSPTGLIPFNAILIIDISRSMMARDVEIRNIAPAIEGIKAAMYSPEIQEFLKKFKEGISVPRRIAAAFAAVLFLSEKVGRGFGEKVSVIRFADEAQVLPFQGGLYMDSASGEKGILEDCARMIVDRIGNAYGQATNMGAAMLAGREVLYTFEQINPDQPTMLVILTDGVPTDVDNFLEAIKQFSENPNVVIYIVGLGNPDDQLMNRAANLCGGEYFKPNDAGELLIWYSKRARDLTVKLKAHK